MNYRCCELIKTEQKQRGKSDLKPLIYLKVEWVPEHLAEKGRMLRSHINQDVWDNGWVVRAVLTKSVDSIRFPPTEWVKLWRVMPAGDD